MTNETTDIQYPFNKTYIINGIECQVKCISKEEFIHEKQKCCMRRSYYKNLKIRREKANQYYKDNQDRENQKRLENYHKNKHKKGIVSREEYRKKFIIEEK